MHEFGCRQLTNEWQLTQTDTVGVIGAGTIRGGFRRSTPSALLRFARGDAPLRACCDAGGRSVRPATARIARLPRAGAGACRIRLGLCVSC